MLINVTRTDQDGQRIDAATFYNTIDPCEYCKPLLRQAQAQKEDIELIISFKYEEDIKNGSNK